MPKKTEEKPLCVFELPESYSAVIALLNSGLGGKIIYKNFEIYRGCYRNLVFMHGWREVNAAIYSVSANKSKKGITDTDYKNELDRITFCLDMGHHLKWMQQKTPESELFLKPIEIEVTQEQQDWINKAIAGEVSVEFMFDRVSEIAEQNRKDAKKQNSYKDTPEYAEAVAHIDKIKAERMMRETELFEKN